MQFKPLEMWFGLVNVVQAQSLARDALKYVGAILLAKGIGDTALLEAFSGFTIAAIGTIYSQWQARQAKLVSTAGKIVHIEADLQTAAGVPNPKTPGGT